MIPLHIKAQNAGMLVWRRDAEVIFETFELTPLSSKVTTTEGRLKRSFPTEGVSVDLSVFVSPDFRSALASTIAKMSFQVVPEMCNEIRAPTGNADDSVAPHLVSGLMASFLLANGKSTSEATIWKHTREEVTLAEGKSEPWKRSPVWLLLRVALQLQMSRTELGAQNHSLYKRFMIFFMSQLLRDAVKGEFGSDLLYTMSAKMARRLVKLDLRRHEQWMQSVHKIMAAATHLLEARRMAIIAKDKRVLGLTGLTAERAEADVKMHLPDLDVFVAQMSSRQHEDQSPAFSPPSGMLCTTGDDFPDIEYIKVNQRYEFHNLCAFETWVATNLESWTQRHINERVTCARLRHAIQAYHEIASACYAGSAEGNSAAILTILELWVACDKSAVAQHRLLEEFNHDIPHKPCEFLLLRFRSDLERLHRVEKYLSDRTRNAATVGKGLSAIYNAGQAKSFSTRFVADSVVHQGILDAITRHVEEQRSQQSEELDGLKLRFDHCMGIKATATCQDEEFVDFQGRTQKRHAARCQRCLVEEELALLDINVLEEPLPASKHEAASVVFELRVPPAFAAWRDATVLVLNDVLQLRSRHEEKPSMECTLESFADVANHLDRAPSEQRVILATEMVPGSVRSRVPISAELELANVCIPSSIRWHHFDKKTSAAIGRPTMTEAVARMCSLKFDEYSATLQPYLKRERLPNAVLTRQAECPPNMSQMEFRALCSIPFAQHTQWMNILIQLAIPSVD